MSTTQGVKLDETIKRRLKALAETRKRTPHWLMRTAIEDYLDREERYERELAEDMAEWEHYKLTGEGIPHKQVSKWLNDLAQGKKTKKPTVRSK